MSYLNFVSDGTSPSGKTKKWIVQSLDGIILGRISWFSAFRKYTFSVGDVTFDAGCLREIANYIEGTTTAHKESR